MRGAGGGGGLERCRACVLVGCVQQGEVRPAAAWWVTACLLVRRSGRAERSSGLCACGLPLEPRCRRHQCRRPCTALQGSGGAGLCGLGCTGAAGSPPAGLAASGLDRAPAASRPAPAAQHSVLAAGLDAAALALQLHPQKRSTLRPPSSPPSTSPYPCPAAPPSTHMTL
jgi:hypothetical protein